VTRQPGAFGAQPPFELADERPDPFRADREPLLGGDTVDLALDREDFVNAAHRFDSQRRFAEIGHEEFAPAMAPAGRLGDRAGPAPGIVEIAKPGISIGLEDPGIAGEMPVGVLAVAIARVEEQCCGRVGAGERPIVPDISPYTIAVGSKDPDIQQRRFEFPVSANELVEAFLSQGTLSAGLPDRPFSWLERFFADTMAWLHHSDSDESVAAQPVVSPYGFQIERPRIGDSVIPKATFRSILEYATDHQLSGIVSAEGAMRRWTCLPWARLSK